MTEKTAKIVALRLSKAGYGRPDEILAMPCDLVVSALNFELFLKQYEAEIYEINKVV